MKSQLRVSVHAGTDADELEADEGAVEDEQPSGLHRALWGLGHWSCLGGGAEAAWAEAMKLKRVSAHKEARDACRRRRRRRRGPHRAEMGAE